MEVSKRMLYQLSWVTIIGFSFVGMILNFLLLHRRPLDLLLFGDSPIYEQLGIGAIYGVLTGLVALVAVNFGLAKELSSHLKLLFQDKSLRMMDAVFFSFCAGFGEEVFFRGAIQPLLTGWLGSMDMGVWITSVVFVAIHGYLNPTSLSVFAYGVLMVLMSAGLGYLCEWYGLIAAIMGHFLFDVVMFYYLLKKMRV